MKTEKKKMSSSRKVLIASILALALVAGAVVSLVLILAAPQQNIGSDITVSYEVVDVGAKVNGTYATVPTIGTITKQAMTGGPIEFLPNEPERQPEDRQLSIGTAIELTSSTQRVVFEYMFENTTEKSFIITLNDNDMTNKNMKDFKTYLFQKPYVFMEVSEEYSIHNYHKCREIESFLKISLPTRKGREVFYDISIIQDGVKALINRPQNRLFIDLEFSLNSPLSRGVSEIVQYGLILEDADGNILMEDASLVRPFNPNALNVKTLLFLSRSLEDFDSACSYIEFYQLLKNIIEEYDPKIFAWGKNDILAMENSFKVNHLRPLDIRNRYINLMQVMKNYYSYKQEKGLFATYQEMTKTEETDQIHDAFEDALIEREIFHLFKNEINKA